MEVYVVEPKAESPNPVLEELRALAAAILNNDRMLPKAAHAIRSLDERDFHTGLAWVIAGCTEGRQVPLAWRRVASGLVDLSAGGQKWALTAAKSAPMPHETLVHLDQIVGGKTYYIETGMLRHALLADESVVLRRAAEAELARARQWERSEAAKIETRLRDGLKRELFALVDNSEPATAANAKHHLAQGDLTGVVAAAKALGVGVTFAISPQ